MRQPQADVIGVAVGRMQWINGVSELPILKLNRCETNWDLCHWPTQLENPEALGWRSSRHWESLINFVQLCAVKENHCIPQTFMLSDFQSFCRGLFEFFLGSCPVSELDLFLVFRSCWYLWDEPESWDLPFFASDWHLQHRSWLKCHVAWLNH